MAADADFPTLHAELLAVQAVVIALARRLACQDAVLGRAVCAAFDEAESMMTGVAVRLGAEAAPGSTLGALRVIAEMRDAAIRDESVCGPG
ncbi:MAG TPA: hypothetical protein VKI45_01135 [Allosphingosinicella sp.]|nr:hypothetical protein [Allosphingosinicella sp.]